ncbi:MAG: FkbM family methyltransferase [bacterium]|nr:FkbM family methyltransferase [bacterium]
MTERKPGVSLLKKLARRSPDSLRQAARLANELLPTRIARVVHDDKEMRFLVDAIPTPSSWQLSPAEYEDGFGLRMIELFEQAERGAVFYDIGASHGVYSVLAQVYGLNVVAFEPDFYSRRRLRDNIRHNSPPNDVDSGAVQTFGFALTDCDGMETMHSDGLYGASPSLSQSHGQKRVKLVPTYRLDTLTNTGALPPPRIIKMDIEGFEVRAIQGARETLSMADHFLLEMHPAFIRQNGDDPDEIPTMLEDLGYVQNYQQMGKDGNYQIHYINQHDI